MKNLKRTLFSILMILPLAAVAHGEEVLLILFTQIIAFLIVLLVLFSLTTTYSIKFVLFLVYIVTQVITFYICDFTYGAFLRNKVGISIGLTIPSIVMTALVYLIFQKNKKRRKG